VPTPVIVPGAALGPTMTLSHAVPSRPDN
jgi:hypothetical protein